MEGPASMSRKRTMMNVVVRFLHFFIHSIETDYSFYPTDRPRALCQRTSMICRTAPERSSPSLEGCGIDNLPHQAINHTHQPFRMPTVAGPPAMITSQQLQCLPATTTTHTPNAVVVNDDEGSTTEQTTKQGGITAVVEPTDKVGVGYNNEDGQEERETA